MDRCSGAGMRRRIPLSALRPMRDAPPSLRKLVRPCSPDPDSMLRAVGHVVHPNLDLDAPLRDRKLGSELGDHQGCGLEGIRYFLPPGGALGLALIVQPHLDRIAIILLADPGEQVRVARAG